MRRAFVTGGSGFIGRRLLRQLTEQGVEAVALARTAKAADACRTAGASKVVTGDLVPEAAVPSGLDGVDTVFHLAARVGAEGPPDLFRAVNVVGTRNLADQAARAGVSAFVFASTEQVLVGETSPLRMVDETHPYPRRHLGLYASSKAEAERIVLDAAGTTRMRCVAVRPRLVWGPGDASGLGQLVSAVRARKFAWIGDGRFATSTCYVDNAVEGFIAAAKHGRTGHAYFVTDGAPTEFREFVTQLLATQRVVPPQRAIPRRVAIAAATAFDWMWRRGLFPRPPADRATAVLMSTEMTFSDAKARRELGYTGSVTREAGLAELSEEDQAMRRWVR